jgi:Amt family ammonium transporter
MTGGCESYGSDIAWTLMSTVLVLGMFPGLAFFEAGLLRKKNTTSVLAQVFCGLAILSCMWTAVGYSLTFGRNTHPLIGDFSHAFFLGVSFEGCYRGSHVPEALYVMFQMMFACITPLLMTGAYAERLAWRPFLIFTVAWEVVVYYPVAHWMWAEGGWLAAMGAQDFAGGIVIHTTAGASSLVAVALLGHREQFDKYHGEFPYSSLTTAATGAAMLWTGWFGFNGGSALGANGIAIRAVVNSQIGAVTAAVTYMLIVYKQTGHPSTIAVMNGAIAGLAGVTPAAGYITPLAAFVLGILLGLTAHFGILLLKHTLRFDDALDVSAVHGLTGVVGSLYVGVCGAKVAGATGTRDGLIASGSWDLLAYQTVAVLVCGAWAAVWTWLILRAIALRMPIRVSPAHERRGLDHGIHNEAAQFRSASAHPFAGGASFAGTERDGGDGGESVASLHAAAAPGWNPFANWQAASFAADEADAAGARRGSARVAADGGSFAPHRQSVLSHNPMAALLLAGGGEEGDAGDAAEADGLQQSEGACLQRDMDAVMHAMASVNQQQYQAPPAVTSAAVAMSPPPEVRARRPVLEDDES